MKDGDIDTYVANFEQLARKAGYRLDTPQTINIFTDGLPQELYAKVYQFDELRNYEEWKNATIVTDAYIFTLVSHVTTRAQESHDHIT